MKFLFLAHAQDYNVKYIYYWLEEKKLEEKCLPGDIKKQILRNQA